MKDQLTGIKFTKKFFISIIIFFILLPAFINLDIPVASIDSIESVKTSVDPSMINSSSNYTDSKKINHFSSTNNLDKDVFSGNRGLKISRQSSTHASIYISGNSDFLSQVSSEGWPGSGTQANPYVIANLNISSQPYENRISISNTNLVFSIVNCTVKDDIYLYNVDYAKIHNSTVSRINVDQASNCVVSNNSVYSGLISIIGDQNDIVNNTVINSTNSDGINVWGTYATVKGNYVYNSEEHGLRIGADNCLITDNIIINSRRYNLYLDGADNAEIMNNDFIDENYIDVSQARDGSYGPSGNNFSYNFWSDWQSPDADENSIVDYPYLIIGNTFNKDTYPRTAPRHYIFLDGEEICYPEPVYVTDETKVTLGLTTGGDMMMWSGEFSNKFVVGQAIGILLQITNFISGDQPVIADGAVFVISDEVGNSVWNKSMESIGGWTSATWSQIDHNGNPVSPGNYSAGVIFINPHDNVTANHEQIVTMQIHVAVNTVPDNWSSDFKLFNNTVMRYSYKPVTMVDSQDNINIIFYGAVTNGDQQSIHFMKISPNGTVIIFPTLIVYNAYIRSPDSAAIDNEDNIHLVWQYSSNINYMKIDNTGNTLISGRTILSYNGLDYPSIKIGTDNKARIVAKDRYGFTFAILDESANVIHSQNGISNAREPGFALDSSNSAFVIYLDDNYPDIRFTKLNSNGSVAIFNQKISDVDRWEVKPKALIDSNGFITFIWIDSISQNHSINAVKIDPSGNLIKGPVMIDSFTSMSWNDLEFSSLIDISDDIWISSSCSEDGYDTDLSEIFYLVVNSDDLSRSTNFTRLTAHGGDSVYPSLVAGLNNQTIEVVWVDYRYDDVVLYYKFLGVKISTFSANINDGATCSNVLAVKVTSTAPGTGEVYLDGSLITVLVLMNSSTFILDTTAYPDNLYNLTVAFMDVHGNVTVRSYMIEFNNTPVIPLSMNVNMTGGSVYTGLIAVVVTSNKPASGNVYLDGSRVNSLVLMNTTSFTINTAASTDGIHELTIFIQDSTGDNVSSTYSVEFYNPVSYLFLSSNMTAGATYSGWLTATVTSSKTATGSVYFDDTLIASLVFMNTGSFSIDTAAYSDGEHNLTITATGMAGSGVTRTYLINFQNDYSNGTGTTSDGMDSSTLPFTPGFEVVTLLGALVTAVTILRRRKSTD